MGPAPDSCILIIIVIIIVIIIIIITPPVSPLHADQLVELLNKQPKNEGTEASALLGATVCTECLAAPAIYMHC
jgi:hypothetical protein